MKLACLLEAFQAPGHDREGKRMNKENNGPKDPTLGKTCQGWGTLGILGGDSDPRRSVFIRGEEVPQDPSLRSG